MVKYIAFLIVVLVNFNSFSQTLKFKELLQLYRGEWSEARIDSTLKERGFEKTISTFCNDREIAYTNLSDRDEKLYIQNNSIQYEISDFLKGSLFWEYNYFEIDGIEKEMTFKQEPSNFKENYFVFENYFTNGYLYAKTGMFMNFSGPKMKPPTKKIFCIYLFNKESCVFNPIRELSVPRSKM